MKIKMMAVGALALMGSSAFAAVPSSMQDQARKMGPRDGARGSSPSKDLCSFAYGIQKFGPDEEEAGTNITYTVIVQNLGNCDLRNVNITDRLPEGTTYVTSTPGSTLDGDRVRFKVSELEEGDVAVLQVTVVADSEETGEFIVNRSSAFAPQIGIRIASAASTFIARH